MKPLVFSAVTGALLVGLFPAFNVPYLAPVALVPLLLALDREAKPSRRFLWGCVAGWVFWGGTCYWIYGVMHVHGHVPPVGAAALFAGFFLLKGLHMGVFGWLAGWSLDRPWAIPAVAASWVAIEGTHQYAGFTWLMLGNAASDMAVVARLAPFTGVMGMSFALAMLNAGVVLAVRRRPRIWLAPLLALPFMYALPALRPPPRGTHTALLVQPNIDEQELFSAPWTQKRAIRLVQEFAVLSSGSRPPELIVWPENPAPLYFYTDPWFRDAVQSVARRQHAYLLFGTVAFRDQANREPLNSAVLLGPDGSEIARYDKMNLAPFGEFVPWPFDYLVEKITREAGDFVPGDRVVIAPVGDHRVGTFICYESVFGSSVARFAAAGAELLINISNDGWFGRSAAREQHLLIARMRAMEVDRWLLRATNTGVTAIIDPAGRVRTALPPDRPGALDGNFDFVSQRTLYTRWGDWFWLMALAAQIPAIWKRGKRL